MFVIAASLRRVLRGVCSWLRASRPKSPQSLDSSLGYVTQGRMRVRHAWRQALSAAEPHSQAWIERFS
eukprot:6671719-Prymnesium_polylepis.1